MAKEEKSKAHTKEQTEEDSTPYSLPDKENGNLAYTEESLDAHTQSALQQLIEMNKGLCRVNKTLKETLERIKKAGKLK